MVLDDFPVRHLVMPPPSFSEPGPTFYSIPPRNHTLPLNPTSKYPAASPPQSHPTQPDGPDLRGATGGQWTPLDNLTMLFQFALVPSLVGCRVVDAGEDLSVEALPGECRIRHQLWLVVPAFSLPSGVIKRCIRRRTRNRFSSQF